MEHNDGYNDDVEKAKTNMVTIKDENGTEIS
jgi:hypothetical protein